jgi:hypothetical protein
MKDDEQDAKMKQSREILQWYASAVLVGVTLGSIYTTSSNSDFEFSHASKLIIVKLQDRVP